MATAWLVLIRINKESKDQSNTRGHFTVYNSLKLFAVVVFGVLVACK